MNRTSRRLRGVIIGLVVAALPVAALASHGIFTDVPDTLNSHDAIYRIYDAGLTSGDTATTYAPTKNVNRGQMASFLGRASSRIAYSGNGGTFVPVATDGGGTDLAAATLTPGGVVAGATNFVKADASFSVLCNDVVACQVLVTVHDGTDQSRVVSVNLAAGETQHASISWANDVQTLADVTLTLTAIASGGAAEATGELTAVYAPFGADGGDTLEPAP